jgi:hypothetical protein
MKESISNAMSESASLWLSISLRRFLSFAFLINFLTPVQEVSCYSPGGIEAVGKELLRGDELVGLAFWTPQAFWCGDRNRRRRVCGGGFRLGKWDSQPLQELTAFVADVAANF